MKRVLFFLAVLILPAAASATTWHVPGDTETIAMAIQIAAPGDTVLVAAGTYFERDIAMKSGVVLRSDGGDPAGVTIDAQQLGRAVESTDQALVVIEGFTFTGGSNAGGGGAIILRGGAIASLTDCVFVGNSSTLYGGAIYYDAEIPANSLSLTRCTFVNNHTVGWDGAALNVRSAGVGTVTITDCRFEANVADFWGGAIEFGDCTATVTGTVFDGNLAHDLGGAIFMQDSTVELLRCTFAQNQAGSYGGAIFQNNGRLTITSCTFNANGASDQGGCFCLNGAAIVDISNTIVAFSSHGAAAWGSGIVSGFCNDIFGNVGGDFTGPLADLEGTNRNFAADPLFCGDDNPDMPFSLDESSPCAEANCPDCGLVGAWPVGCSGGIAGIDGIPSAVVSLAPNRPNPFNPRTTIAFSVSTAGLVHLQIHDLRGRLITTLLNTSLPAGHHQVVWDGTDGGGRDVPGGVYFSRLEAGGRMAYGRMTLVR